jgi:3-oxoacyl-[acyl-carrier protein] reductase
MADSKKVALVTGSATGVGAATCRKLAGLGWNVVVNYTKSRKEAEETAAACRALGADVLLCQADVSKDADCRRMVDETVKRWGRIDAVVSSAGYTKFVHHGDLEAMTSEEFLKTLSINLLGPFQVVRAAVPHLKASGNAAVVFVSSVAGVNGGGSSIAYSASKAALNNMTKSLARVLGPEIRVNAICPAFIEGRWLVEGMGQARYDAYRDNLVKTVTLRHATTPDDVADQIYWFIGGASIVTGQVLVTDAGFTLGPVPSHSTAGSENRAERAKETTR